MKYALPPCSACVSSLRLCLCINEMNGLWLWSIWKCPLSLFPNCLGQTPFSICYEAFHLPKWLIRGICLGKSNPYNNRKMVHKTNLSGRKKQLWQCLYFILFLFSLYQRTNRQGPHIWTPACRHLVPNSTEMAFLINFLFSGHPSYFVWNRQAICICFFPWNLDFLGFGVTNYWNWKLKSRLPVAVVTIIPQWFIFLENNLLGIKMEAPTLNRC